MPAQAIGSDEKQAANRSAFPALGNAPELVEKLPPKNPKDSQRSSQDQAAGAKNRCGQEDQYDPADRVKALISHPVDPPRHRVDWQSNKKCTCSLDEEQMSFETTSPSVGTDCPNQGMVHNRCKHRYISVVIDGWTMLGIIWVVGEHITEDSRKYHEFGYRKCRQHNWQLPQSD
ncbi:hypothetical protein [Bosea beijingensis]|uniref:hypothetical protein n=1 Tax=Bosea beijingensis TaxID=3068632 RepID=UPI002740EBDA|nr:hypothetical protein [Bosea sp. REN20]